MTFIVKIGYDEGNAVTGPARVAEALGKAEDGADRARNAMGQFAKTGGEAGETVARGMGQAATAAGTTAGSFEELKAIAAQLSSETVSVSKAAVEAAEAIEAGATASNRQLEVLERILGPAREYNADVNALNALMAQGKVNAAQYDTELERLNTQFGTMHGPISQIAEREAAAVERIRGPMQRYEQEIATLGRVLDQGRITAAEYEAEVDRLNARMGIHQLQGPVSQFADREAAALARIRGPMQQYEQEVATLTRLMDQGKITADEYATELEKQAKKAGVFQGPVRQQSSGGGVTPPAGDATGSLTSALGAGGALLAGGAVGAAVVGLGHSIQSLIDKYHEVEDVSINAGNAALKFADAGHTVNLVIDEQIALARDLHSNFSATIDVYDAVRDGTDDLNVSHAEQIRLTKSLGEEVQIAGKSLESAGGLIQRFSYALASGRIETRELKGIMREVPDIADTWTKHFDTTRQGLMEMVKAGTVSTEDLMRALIDEGAAIDANFEKRKRTNKQKEEEWLLNEKLLSQRYDVGMGGGNLIQEQAAGLRANQDYAAIQAMAESGSKAAQVALDQIHDANTAAITETIDQIKNLTGAFHTIGDAYRKFTGDTAEVRAETQKLTEPIVAARHEVEVLNTAFSTGKIGLEDYIKRWQELQTTIGHGIGSQALKITEPIRQAQQELARFLDEIEAGADVSQAQFRKAFAQYQSAIHGGVMPEELKLKNPVLDAKDALADLNKAMAAGKITGEAYKREYEALATTINDGRLPEAIKIWNALHDPVDQASRDLAALNSLFRGGRIHVSEYVTELKQIAATNKSSDAIILAESIARLDGFLAHGTLTLRDYNAQVAQLVADSAGVSRVLGGYRVTLRTDPNTPKLPTTRETDAAAGAAASASTLGAYKALREQLDAAEASGTGAAKALEELHKSMALGDQFVAPLVTYETALNDIDRALHENMLTQQQATFLQRQARDEYEKAEEALGKVKTPLDAYNDELRRLNEQLQSGALSASKYDDAIDKARQTLLEATGASKTFAGGMELEWIKLKGEADSYGATVAGSLVGGIDKLNSALVDSISNSGKYDQQLAELNQQLAAGTITQQEYAKSVDKIGVQWGEVVDSIIRDLERLLIKQLEVQAVTGLMNLISPGAGDAAASSGLTAPLTDLFPHGGDSGPVTSPSQVSAAPPAYAYPTTSSASQSISSAPSAAPTIVLNNHNYLSDSVVAHALTSRAGERAVTNILRRRGGK